MSVYDLWKGLSKAEVEARRRAGRPRWQRRWREGVGADARQRKQSYKEHQKSQAYLDDATERADPRARRIVDSSVTVTTLLDRHLATKTDRAASTVDIDRGHAGHVRAAFGDRVVSTLTPTEIEIWSVRDGVAAESRKKQVEILRAAIKRGIRDKLVETDPTDGIVVALKAREISYLSSEELLAVAEHASDDMAKTLLLTLGLLGLRREEAIALKVGDLRDGHLTVRKSKTNAGVRTLPVPASLSPHLVALAGDRPRSAWMFPSPRRAAKAVAKSYPGARLTAAIAKANLGRNEKIERITVHGLRHTFAAIALSEAGADVLSVSRAMGHARASVTLNRYGHLAKGGLTPLMTKIDEVIAALS